MTRLEQFDGSRLETLANSNTSTIVPFWDYDTRAHVDASAGATPEVRHAFLNGACHGLAAHIHDIAGHPIGKIFFKGEEDQPTHYFNYDKDDASYGYDINGRRPVSDIVESVGMTGGTVAHKPLSVEAFNNEVDGNEMLPPVNHRVSRMLARDVLLGKAN